MFTKPSSKPQPTDPVAMAGARSHMYALMVRFINQLPDQELLEKIKSREFEELFNQFSGAAYLKTYRERMENNPTDDILNELSVDRTRILRGTGPAELKPPHEGCYKLDCDLGSAAIQVKCFYRSAGLVPDETVCEPPDYLCVQLDFMRQLCQQEQYLRSSNRDVEKVITCQDEFLKKHLGCWVTDFCGQVHKHALTDFYRGITLILGDFIKQDMEYLHFMVPA